MTFRRLIALSSGVACAVALMTAADAKDDSLYRDLGGEAGIEKITALATEQYLTDPRIKQVFGNSNMDRFKLMFAQQLCDVSGGPCEYRGHSMRDTHRGLHLTNADFNFVVEGLQKALDQAGVAFRVQNRLLAVLAPMRRDIVTR
jgi:hemoglobin